jgi:predicted nicotinamide N-methyase
MELGCGSGAVGVAAARARAALLLLTDGNASSVANCRHNCALNGVPTQPWTDDTQLLLPPKSLSSSLPQSSIPVLGAPDNADASTARAVSGPVLCGVLEWEHTAQQLPRDWQPEVVLGSDLLYDPGAALGSGWFSGWASKRVGGSA